MKALTWIAGFVALAGAIAASSWLARAREADEVDLAGIGEVRGAPLRSPIENGAAQDATGEASTAEPASPSDEAGARPPAEDYADLLPPGEAEKYSWIDFDLLTSFDYADPAAQPEGASPPSFPDEVRELHGAEVAIEGFMNPLAFDAGGVSEFTLVADPTFCCFGATPKLNHFVHVSLPEGERCDFHSMVPIAVFGELAVGAVEEDGFVLSLYRLVARHVLTAY